LSDLKKTARQVLRSWGRIVQTLKPGQTLQVTARGKPLVNITKPAAEKRVLPDFARAARADRAGTKVGDRLSFQTASENGFPKAACPRKETSGLKSDAPRILSIFGTRPHQIGEQPGAIPSSRRRTLDTIFCRAARRTRFDRLPHAFAEG